MASRSRSRLRVGFFTDTYLPNVDGVVSSLLTYRAELERRGHRVFVYASGSADDAAQNGGARARYYPSVAFPLYPQYKVAVWPHAAKQDASRDRLDLVHCHGLASMALAATRTAHALDAPLVGTFHTLVPLAARAMLPFGRRHVERLAWSYIQSLYAPFDAVTAPTQAIADLLDANGVRGVRVVPNGVDTQRFNPRVDGRVVRKLLGLPPNDPVILLTGRLSHEKNVPVVLRALARIRRLRPRLRFHAIVTGDGPARASCAKLARRLKLDNVFFTGFVRPFELPFYYAASTAYATASTFETQGVALLEAMASGTPVVGADALAIPEAVRNGRNGFLFPPGDADACARRLLDVLDLSPRSQRAFSRAARRTAEQYSVEKSTDALLRVYREFV